MVFQTLNYFLHIRAKLLHVFSNYKSPQQVNLDNNVKRYQVIKFSRNSGLEPLVCRYSSNNVKCCARRQGWARRSCCWLPRCRYRNWHRSFNYIIQELLKSKFTQHQPSYQYFLTFQTSISVHNEWMRLSSRLISAYCIIAHRKVSYLIHTHNSNPLLIQQVNLSMAVVMYSAIYMRLISPNMEKQSIFGWMI